MEIENKFLLTTAILLIPIALSYGLLPNTTLPFLFDIDATAVNVTHIFRSVMGLYLCLSLFWMLGAFVNKYQLHALYSLVIFMLGLALGRFISVVLDSMPHWLLFVYMLLELGFFFVGVIMIKKAEKSVKEKL